MESERKHAIAQSLFRREEFCLSGQVLAEFYVIAKKQIIHGITHGQIEEWVEALTQFEVLPVDSSVVKAGIANSENYQISYWDGAIIAAAEILGAPILYSEDLNHGQKYGSVTVINPFKAN